MAILHIANPFVLTGLASAVVAYCFLVVIYRLTFHPLAKYPGPILNRITSWPEGISAWRLTRHIDLDSIHEKYGDIVRFSPNKLSFRSAKAWHDIYTDRHANMIKTGFTESTQKMNNIYHTHNLSDRKLHAARRKVLNHAFSENAMKSFEPVVNQKIENWCDLMSRPATDGSKEKGVNKRSQWSQQRNMGSWSGFLTTDVLGQLCFSLDMESCKNEGCVWDDTVPRTMVLASSTAFLPIGGLIFPFIRSDRFMAMWGNKNGLANIKFKESAGECVMKRFALEEAEKEKDQSERTKDFLYYLFEGNNPETGDKFQPMELVGEAILLVVAGSDTSSTALAAVFFYLVHNPRVLEKLKSEVRSSFSDVQEITASGGKLRDLPYLRACIDEAMRMSPPVPTLMDRKILAGGAEIDGTLVPEGITVGVPIYTLQHNARYHQRPHEFIPERWIEGSLVSETRFKSTVTEHDVEEAKSAFVPFSTGVRGCVGKNLAYMELLTALARVVYLFDMQEAPETSNSGRSRGSSTQAKGVRRDNKGEYQLEDIFVARRDGPMIEFKKREGLQV